MILAFAGLALAGSPRCAPLDEVEFRRDLLQLREAVDADDAATHGALLEDVEGRLPCADFAPSRQLWAELLVHEALQAFGAGGDWQTPLAAALQVFPAVDREVGPGHPMAAWEPPVATTDAGPPLLAPPGVLLYVDGEGALAAPPATGIHLVQKSDGRWWAGRVLRDAAVTADWLAAPIPAPPHLAGWVDAAAFAGAALGGQRVDPPADWLAADDTRAAAGSLRLDVRTALRSNFGVAGALSAHLAPASAAGAPEGRLGGCVSSGAAWLSLGAALATIPVATGGAFDRFRLGYPYVAAGVHAFRPWSTEITAIGGASAAVLAGDLRVAVLPAGGAWRPRIGARGAITRALLAQDGTDARVAVDAWTAGLELGASWSTEP